MIIYHQEITQKRVFPGKMETCTSFFKSKRVSKATH